MAYIPKGAQWFLGQHVEEIRVQKHKRSVVHINYVLIQAKTPNEAYRKAMELGKQANAKYKNRAGETVTIRFLGLRNLDVIHDTLEHGCEIMFSERVGMTKAGIQKLVRKKEELELFLPVRKQPTVPDYASKTIMDEVARQLRLKALNKAQGLKQNLEKSKTLLRPQII
ncbi:MAG: hypothetical protein JWN25_3339 [Verrucomicrobiales bacterium]|nr:hypothetical protein [Verrucomicrobiales bacterium]